MIIPSLDHFFAPGTAPSSPLQILRNNIGSNNIHINYNFLLYNTCQTFSFYIVHLSNYIIPLHNLLRVIVIYLGFPFSKVEPTVYSTALPFYGLKLKGYKFAARLSQFSSKNAACHDRTRQL